MEPPAKRARPETPAATSTAASGADDQFTRAQLSALLEEIPNDLSTLLLQAALKHPDVAIDVATLVAQKRREKAERVLGFGYNSKEAWHAMNTRHKRDSGRRQYEAAGGIAWEIKDMLDDMLEQTKVASFGTRFSALETTRKIYKGICMSDGEIPEEVRSVSSSWPELMALIVGHCTDDERTRIASDDEWMDKLDELIGLAGSYAVFEYLGKVYADLDKCLEDA